MNEMSCLLAAASFAAEKHRDQRRKDAVPELGRQSR